MAKKQIVNIINFLRALEPREEYKHDVFIPFKNQLKILKELDIGCTYLVQYDAMILPEYNEVLKSLDKEKFEIGVWFEVVEPLCEKAGIKWTGRYPWDWYAHCGFSVGYSREDRMKLIDVFFEDFKEMFCYYPKSFGSWAFDSFTLNYVYEKYGIDAACICKEQWGTDGYNLWGGYYNQAYYPSKFNMLSPAQTSENEIHVPTFRMLGSDPVYQYDAGFSKDGSTKWQHVITLEPAYGFEPDEKIPGGANEKWINWYFKENFSGNCLSFGYTQAGQENSFNWNEVHKGLEYQLPLIKKLHEEDKITLETLGESGRWYKENYKETPASTVVALEDWQGEEVPSIWYCNKNYRINIYAEDKKFWVRDIYLFDENYKDRYYNAKCEGNVYTFDTLPVIDGFRFCGEGLRSGLYPAAKVNNLDEGLAYEEMSYEEIDGNAIVTFKGTALGDVKITLTETEIIFNAEKDLVLNPVYSEKSFNTYVEKAEVAENRYLFTYNGFDYGVEIKEGKINGKSVISKNGRIIIKMR